MLSVRENAGKYQRIMLLFNVFHIHPSRFGNIIDPWNGDNNFTYMCNYISSRQVKTAPVRYGKWTRAGAISIMVILFLDTDFHRK